MAATLPTRYQLEIRLGRDHDVEEWLATDLTLDRPVLVRMLGPEVDATRRKRFLADVRSLASVTHPHLLEVYAAGTDGEHTWMVAEWAGGVSVADRIKAGTPMPVVEFLPNAAGLADALAELHALGTVHGAIGPDAISFSTAHPAKLMSFARPDRGQSPEADVADLARALEAAITGLEGNAPPPSQLNDALDRSVDTALAEARAGSLSAAELAARLQAAPTARRPARSSRWSWRWAIPALILGLVALVTTLFGPFRRSEAEPPFALPDPPTTTVPPTTTTTTTLPDIRVIVVDVLDPSQDGERDGELPNLTDGDTATAWRTERYFAPISLIKPGVGVTFVLDQSPGSMEFDASGGTSFEIRWAATFPDDLEGWETINSGLVTADLAAPFGTISVDVPARAGGFWLLWLTDLAFQGQSDDDPPRDFFYSFVFEVRFSP
ncbi:MAG: protein kinase [Acidimicrobiia bacterium]|nr:protein kinase [Acidimicrobiia bacterium]